MGSVGRAVEVVGGEVGVVVRVVGGDIDSEGRREVKYADTFGKSSDRCSAGYIHVHQQKPTRQLPLKPRLPKYLQQKK